MVGIELNTALYSITLTHTAMSSGNYVRGLIGFVGVMGAGYGIMKCGSSQLLSRSSHSASAELTRATRFTQPRDNADGRGILQREISELFLATAVGQQPDVPRALPCLLCPFPHRNSRRN